MEESREKIVVVDSHALFWFVTENDKLSAGAHDAIVGARKVIVPIIAILEIVSILEKHNATIRLPDFFGALYRKHFYIYPLDRRVLRKYLLTTPTVEIHDRIIIATAKVFDCPLITRDKEIQRTYPRTIW